MAEAVRRKVLVLGRRPSLDAGAVVGGAVNEASPLLLLSVGAPQSPEQSDAVARLVERAFEYRIPLVAELVPSARGIGTHLTPSDDVEVAATGRERGRLERVVAGARRGPRPRRRSSTPARTKAGESAAGPLAGGSRAPAAPSPFRSPRETVTIEAMLGHRTTTAAEADPDVGVAWTREEAERRKRARLTIYFGAAPGVGKTFAMLSEAHRAVERGTDVVVGVVETYGRQMTIAQLEGLERVPPRRVDYRGASFDELDVEAVLARDPERVLIDELAHTNVPGSRRAKRWEDVLDLLGAGIAVIGTLNAQHLASLNDVVARVTGVRQQETVPDWILDLADQVELVDMSPHALRRRMVHGNVYPDPAKAELALRRFFTIENLTALRELALMRIANQVDDELLSRWQGRETPETRERVLVCVSMTAVAEELVRRGARIAHRTGGDLLVVHAHRGDEGRDRAWHDEMERLVRELGGEFAAIPADDPVDAVLSHAYEQHVTQIVVGASERSRWEEAVRGSFVARLIRRAADVDVHVIARREL